MLDQYRSFQITLSKGLQVGKPPIRNDAPKTVHVAAFELKFCSQNSLSQVQSRTSPLSRTASFHPSYGILRSGPWSELALGGALHRPSSVEARAGQTRKIPQRDTCCSSEPWTQHWSNQRTCHTSWCTVSGTAPKSNLNSLPQAMTLLAPEEWGEVDLPRHLPTSTPPPTAPEPFLRDQSTRQLLNACVGTSLLRQRSGQRHVLGGLRQPGHPWVFAEGHPAPCGASLP